MRTPKPYLKTGNKAWYVNLNGRQIRLASEAEGEAAAYAQYYPLMAGRQPLDSNCRVAELVARFNDHHKAESALRTQIFYAKPLASFVEFVGPNKRVCDLKAHHVTEWIERCRNTAKRGRRVGTDENGKGKYITADTDHCIGVNYKRNLIRAVKACFKWAEDQEYIPRSPLRKVKVPTAIPRGDEAYLNPEQWEQLMAALVKCRDHGALLDLVTIMRETGCPSPKPDSDTAACPPRHALCAKRNPDTRPPDSCRSSPDARTTAVLRRPNLSPAF